MIRYEGSNPTNLMWAVQDAVELNYVGESQDRGYTKQRLKRLEQTRKATEAVLAWHKETYEPVYGWMFVPPTLTIREQVRSSVLAAFGIWPIFAFLLPYVARTVIDLLLDYLGSQESVQYRYSILRSNGMKP